MGYTIVKYFKKFIHVSNKINEYMVHKLDHFIHMYPNRAGNIVSFFAYIIIFYSLLTCLFEIGYLAGIIPQSIKNQWDLNAFLSNIWWVWCKYVIYKHNVINNWREEQLYSYTYYLLLKYLLYIFYICFVRALITLIYKNAINFLTVTERGKGHYEYCTDFLIFQNMLKQLLSIWVIVSAAFYIFLLFIILFS